MTLNVWMRILPAHAGCLRRGSGEEFDAALGAQAKLRSKHNTFLAVPVVFLMLSNHFPVASYGIGTAGRFCWRSLWWLVAAKLIREL